MRPPVKVAPDPRILPALAPIALCRVHSMNNPVCPEKSYLQWLYREWGKIVPEVYDRGYWFNLADPGFPFPMISRLREDIPLAKTLGVDGWRVECIAKWASESPSLYVAGKLMWDVNTDVDALLRDYYTKFFGPAAGPMGEYVTLLDASLRDADYHTGCAFDMPHFYPPAVREKARTLLAQAGKLADTGIYAKRVQAHRESFEMLDAFIAMLDHRGAGDFIAAKSELDRLRALQKTLLAYDPPMLNPRSSAAYLQRFFAPCTEQGFARVTGGNTLVALLPDVWEFQLDPKSVGEDIGLFRPNVTGGNWQRLATWSRSWSDQGLRSYSGEAWYRTSIDIPAPCVGKRLFLWFGGVDEKAKVWVNGTLLGISHNNAFIPFELDATKAVVPGRNVVVVRVVNELVNELGTGGLMAPAMFYAPAAGDAAVLENVKPLQPTFP